MADRSFVVVGTVGHGWATVVESSVTEPALPQEEEPVESTYRVVLLEDDTPLVEQRLAVSFESADLPLRFETAQFHGVAPFPEETTAVEIREGDLVLAHLDRGVPPEVKVVKLDPPKGLFGDGDINVTWDATGDNLTYSLSYSIDGGKSFRPIEAGLREQRVTISTGGLGGSNDALIRVSATNGFDTASGDAGPISLPVKPPVATIVSHLSAVDAVVGGSLTVRAVALDLQDGVLTDEQLQWYLAGEEGSVMVGQGEEVLVQGLALGESTLRLVASNRLGWTAVDERRITVRPAPDDGAEPLVPPAMSDVYQYVTEHLDWLAEDPVSHYVGCAIGSTQPAPGVRSSRVAINSFAEGYLRMEAKGSLTGELQQYFSDRRHHAHPFSSERTDRLRLELLVDEGPPYVTVDLTALSWEKAFSQLWSLRMENGVLLGTGDPVGQQPGTALYTITLEKVQAPG